MKNILFNAKLTHVTFADCINQIVRCGLSHKPSYLCAVNVHMLVESQDDLVLKKAINNSTWSVTDGMPVVWAFRYFCKVKQNRVAGMDLIPELLEKCHSLGLTLSVYGNTTQNLNTFEAYIKNTYPNIKIGKFISPAFRKLTDEELKQQIDALNTVKSQIVLVSLGCPKQEKWMYANSAKINGVCMGIGNAINTVIGDEKRPPIIFQKLGLEWLFRLLQNPKRLFKRYAITNSRFLLLVFKKILGFEN